MCSDWPKGPGAHEIGPNECMYKCGMDGIGIHSDVRLVCNGALISGTRILLINIFPTDFKIPCTSICPAPSLGYRCPDLPSIYISGWGFPHAKRHAPWVPMALGDVSPFSPALGVWGTNGSPGNWTIRMGFGVETKTIKNPLSSQCFSMDPFMFNKRNARIQTNRS